MKNLLKITAVVLFIGLYGCLEEIDLDNEVPPQRVLVIEGTITNEVKQQEIIISRSVPLDSGVIDLEVGATVRVISSNGSQFNFSQDSDGIYRSQTDFAAAFNETYQLSIETSDGRSYESSSVALTGDSQIDNLYLEQGLNENNEEGINILVDAIDNDPNSQFYRYTYVETYKVIAPTYSPFELLINNDDLPYPPGTLDGLVGTEIIDFFVLKELRPEQEQVCFATASSNNINLFNAEDFESGNLQGIKIRFLNKNNYIISHRYSILVNQFVQSNAAFEFYETLRNLSADASIFSNIQPGFLTGNITSLTNSNELVAGFFEVVSTDSERIYFNYEDEYPGELLPPFIRDCFTTFEPELFLADPLSGEIFQSPIQDAVNNRFQYFEDTGIINMPYIMVFPECGDCTVLGENEPPDFWED